jgi:hypothetical protein
MEKMIAPKAPTAAASVGEPTLHRRLSEMIARTVDAGVTVVLFTNGLFPRDLSDRLSRSVSNFVVNFNDRLTYTSEHRTLDIHPDLSASYCLPMRHIPVPDVTRFANSERLMDLLQPPWGRRGLKGRPENAVNARISNDSTREAAWP